MVKVLKVLALKGAVNCPVSISSREFGREMGISQQSASNWILILISDGYIERQLGAKRQLITLSKKGLDVLGKEYTDYQRIFEAPGKLFIKGVVTTGFGEGRYYITQKGYVNQFKDKLNIEPYEGTLNLKVRPKDKQALELLRNSEGITIRGFDKGGRTFGAVKCYLATIGNVDCAVVMPKRSHYKDVLEVISKAHLRRTLSLKDGDEVELCILPKS